MMRSMYSGVSGLRNHQTRMDVIGNNIANINTAGFKKSRVVFKDTLYQTMRGASGAAEGGVRGGINPMAVGLGMALSSIDQIHTEAPTTNTNKMTDLAIDGDGYFILGNGSERFYTRAGAFEFDGNKTLVSSANGFNVQGWLADKANDYAIADPGKPPTAINLSDYNSIGGRATSEMSFAGNLNAGIDFDAGMDEQQTIKFNTIANGGTVGGFFRLNFDGQNTAWIQVGANSAATAANMQKALEGLTNIGKGNVEVSWDNALQKYDVKFTGELAKTDVAKLVFLPGPAIKFDGGIDTNTVEGGSQHTSLAFADFPEGGVAGSYFQLSVGSLNTGLIQVGADSTATAANIRNALMAIGKPATATWDNANERYNIDFTTDPAAATTFTPITGRLTDGAGGGGSASITPQAPSDKKFTLQFGGSPDPGGNFILKVGDNYTGLIKIGNKEEETANNIQDAINEVLKAPAGSNLVNVAWDGPPNNRFLIDFTSAPTSFNIIELADHADAVFDGGTATCGTKHPALHFATNAEGGSEGGAFTLTMGTLSTGPIAVGADTGTTAKNIEYALNELNLPNGANASVAWDNVNNCYQINFDIDPQQTLVVNAASPFDGGNAAISVAREGKQPLVISPHDEVQSLTFTDNAEGGTPGLTFKLEYDGEITDFIKVGEDTAATSANIKSALEKLSNIGADNIKVAWNAENKAFDITFVGDLQKTDVKAITPVMAPHFDGGAAALSQTGKVSLSFATSPGGGTAGGQFILSVGGRNTGLITVDADQTKTASDIQAKLNAVDVLPNGAQSTVSWNADTNSYDIEFDKDPEADVQMYPVKKVFDGGSGVIGGTNQVATLNFSGKKAGGTEGGNFILSIGGRNTELIEVAASPQATATRIERALDKVLRSLPQGATAVVSWDTVNEQYIIDFNVDPGLLLEATPALALFDGGQSAVSGTRDAILAFAENADGGSEGGIFQLYFGNDSETAKWKTGAIMVGKTTSETAANIQTALNALTLPNTDPNADKATVTWDPLKKQYDIHFSTDPEEVLKFNKMPFDGGSPRITTSAHGSAVVGYAEESNAEIISKDIFDSKGGPHQVYFRFFKYEIQPGDAPNAGGKQPVSRWACDISLDPLFEKMEGYVQASDFKTVDITGKTPSVGEGTGLFRVYNIEFDENGAIKSPNIAQVSFPIDSTGDDTGPANLTIDIDFKNITEFNAKSDAQVDYRDGNKMGDLLGYNIDSSGNINGRYDNGEIRALARLAMRNFRNPSGLLQVGGTLFQESTNTGAMDIGIAGSPGLGTIISSSLEMSNVDLSEEFTDMIVTQRGFQANSRIITTSDEMIQELVNLKR